MPDIKQGIHIILKEGRCQYHELVYIRIEDLGIEISPNICDNLMEEKYRALFKEYPYYDKDKSTELIYNMTDDNELKSISNS